MSFARPPPRTPPTDGRRRRRKSSVVNNNINPIGPRSVYSNPELTRSTESFSLRNPYSDQNNKSGSVIDSLVERFSRSSTPKSFHSAIEMEVDFGDFEEGTTTGVSFMSGEEEEELLNSSTRELGRLIQELELEESQTKIQKKNNNEIDSGNTVLNLSGRNLDQVEVVKILSTVDQCVATIDLSSNKLDSIALLPNNVCVLSLSNNNLSNLAGLESLVNLHQLDVSCNNLHSLKGLYKSSSYLVTLNAKNNCLRFVDGLETMAKLEHLDLSNNRLEKLSDIRSLSCNVRLTEIRLIGNPICKISTFRQHIMDLNPSVLVLDGIKVGSSPQINRHAKSKNWTYSSLYESRQNSIAQQKRQNSKTKNGNKTKQNPLFEWVLENKYKMNAFYQQQQPVNLSSNNSTKTPSKKTKTKKTKLDDNGKMHLSDLETRESKNQKQNNNQQQDNMSEYSDSRRPKSASALDAIGRKQNRNSISSSATEQQQKDSFRFYMEVEKGTGEEDDDSSSLDRAFDNDFEIPKAREIVEKLRRANGYTKRDNFCLDYDRVRNLEQQSVSSAPTKYQNQHKKLSSSFSSVVKSNSSREMYDIRHEYSNKPFSKTTTEYPRNSDNSDDEDGDILIKQQLRELIDKKKASLQNLTKALRKYH